jgi:ABC-type sugar transport system ATPase subunit
MNQGRLQQVGTPRELYEAPANTFVAGFIGMPPVNLIPVDIVCRLAREFPGFVPASRSSINDSRGREAVSGEQIPPGAVTAAVRPEGFCLVAEPLGVPAEVMGVEYLGYEALVHFRLPQQSISGYAPSASVLRAEESIDLRAGQLIRIALRPQTIQWFDEGGASLTLGSRNARPGVAVSDRCDAHDPGIGS